jgi:hypothetical protein
LRETGLAPDEEIDGIGVRVEEREIGRCGREEEREMRKIGR